MQKTQLIDNIASKHQDIEKRIIKKAVQGIINHISCTLANGNRIEIRGFGSFSLRFHQKHEARNPKTGEKFLATDRYIPHFRAGKKLRQRITP